MARWEYLLVPIGDKKIFGVMEMPSTSVVNVMEQNNLKNLAPVELYARLGAQGWELVKEPGPNRPFYTFKRRVD